MVQGCLDDARERGMSGVAVVAREGPWMAGPRLFVDTAPPDFQLLVRQLDAVAGNPSFRGDWGRKLKRYGRGLTLIRTDQCPHIAKFDEIAEAAEDYGVKLKVVELRSHRDAQNAPTLMAHSR